MTMNCQARRDEAFTRADLLTVVAVIVVLGLLLLPSLARTAANTQRITCANQLKQIGVAAKTFAWDHKGRFPMFVPAEEGGPPNQAEFSSSTHQYGAPFLCQAFGVLSNHLASPRLLTCPTDERTPHTNFLTTLDNADPASLTNGYISYFLGRDATMAHPQSLLAGDRNIWGSMAVPTPNWNNVGNNGYGNNSSSAYAMGTNWPMMVSIGWTAKMHQTNGNVLLSDGSVRQLKSGGVWQFSSASLIRQLCITGDTSGSLGPNVLLFP